MGELTGAEGKASLIYIKSDSSANDDLVMQEIHSTRGFGNNTLTTVDSWLESDDRPSKIPGFNMALDVVTGIAVIIGFLVIFQSMYTAVLERTREIGILKSMGASEATIVGVVLRECAVLAVAGVSCGHRRYLWRARSCCCTCILLQSFEITGSWIVLGAAIAFAGPLRRALSRLDGCPQRPDRRPGLRVSQGISLHDFDAFPHTVVC